MALQVSIIRNGYWSQVTTVEICISSHYSAVMSSSNSMLKLVWNMDPWLKCLKDGNETLNYVFQHWDMIWQKTLTNVEWPGMRISAVVTWPKDYWRMTYEQLSAPALRLIYSAIPQIKSEGANPVLMPSARSMHAACGKWVKTKTIDLDMDMGMEVFSYMFGFSCIAYFTHCITYVVQ
jgi:hypothetical protein